jgi:putative hydrolase of the HAD superfamily
MTRAVFFDVDGVLIKQEFIFDLFLKKVIVGDMSVIDALERRLPGLGFKGSPMTFLTYWLKQDSELDLTLMEVVRELKAKPDIRLYLATNQEHMRASWLWGSLGLGSLFEDIFYSARIGVRKPDRKFFQYIEDRIGPQAEPPLFFDDTPEVIDGARRHGWEAVQFDTLEDCTFHPWIAQRLR